MPCCVVALTPKSPPVTTLVFGCLFDKVAVESKSPGLVLTRQPAGYQRELGRLGGSAHPVCSVLPQPDVQLEREEWSKDTHPFPPFPGFRLGLPVRESPRPGAAGRCPPTRWLTAPAFPPARLVQDPCSHVLGDSQGQMPQEEPASVHPRPPPAGDLGMVSVLPKAASS